VKFFVNPSSSSPGHRLAGWWLLPVMIVAGLLPWIKNRGLINDFYDYGVTMTAVGRIAEGERPYRDFVSPLQSGGFLLNGLSEAVFGSTYRGMTAGAGVLISGATLLLAWLWSRRIPTVVAVVLAGATVWAAVCQHTIVWYNSIGVLCLAVVAFGAAVAPVLRRQDAGWYVLLGSALFLGGITKASFQLIALAVAAAWTVRAGATGAAGWGRVARTLVFFGAAGLVFPAGFEMAWAGVDFATWWYNVVSLPGGGRSQDLAVILAPRFYLEHHHNYYGHLPVPWVGLLGVAMSAWVAVHGFMAVRSRGVLEIVFLAGAIILATVAGVALLATNKEIAYISFAGWVVLLVAVWCGFSLPMRPLGFGVGVAAPAIVLGVFGWLAAWQGQRSLWGYSPHPKSHYVPGEVLGEAFRYLHGTRIPPDWVASLSGLAELHAELSPMERDAWFYGSGTEWLERVWPGTKAPGIPLWLDYGTSYSPREMRSLANAIGPGGVFRRVTLTVQRDVWFGESRPVIERNYARKAIGPVVVMYERGEGDGVSIHPLDFIGKHGGNVDSTILHSQMPWHTLSDGRFFIGVSAGKGEAILTVPTRRFQGEMVLQRVGGDASVGLHADFLVTALATDEPPYDRFRRRLELPPGEAERVVPFEGDVNALPLQFSVSILEESAGMVVAGWRSLTILHSIETSNRPPELRPKPWGQRLLGDAEMAVLFAQGRQPVRAYTRGGALTSEGFLLPPGGELWIRAEGTYSPVAGHGVVAPAGGDRADPIIRAFFYRGGRLSITTQEGPRDGLVPFRVWSAEPDGWLVLAADENRHAASTLLRFEELPPPRSVGD
jgi:hypothetical protein